VIALDTNIVLPQMADRLAVDPPEGLCLISVITEIELLSFWKLTQAESAQLAERLRDAVVAELDRDVKQLTIALRRKHRLKLPDAIIAATAILYKADLYTNDLQLHSLTELHCHSIPLKI